ncbi:Protein O-glucosyltransferase 2 [Coccomyxa sp. Obi]|nr:Protein O-glucosyltransferase 2 [Coccomyxa sp. Obi]
MRLPSLSSLRCARRASLPRLCILVVILLGTVVLVDLIPRMVIVALEPRETAYWEAWEEAYINREAGDWMPWLKEKAGITGRRWRTVLFGRKSVKQFLKTECGNLVQTYEPLIREELHWWEQKGITKDLLDRSTDAKVIIYQDKVYLSHGSERARLIPTYHSLIQRVRLRVKLPDMVIPLNPGDEPLAPLRRELDPPTPIFSFCKLSNFSDIMLPNTIEGDVFLRAPDKRAFRPKSRAGPKDPRLPKAVWRGSTGGFGGLVKGRAALLNLGLQRPDLIDSGVLDWDVSKYGDDGGRLKEKMSFGEQVDRYKYLVWVPGNCASVRLALQLASDAAVLKIDSPELEWYYPLLQPWVHYIPMTANETWCNLEEAIGWAEAHPAKVAQIVKQATDFALKYLSARGRDCYFVQLLDAYHSLQRDKVSLGSNVEYTPEWSCC